MLKWRIGFCAAVAAAITLAPVRGHASSLVTQDLTGIVGPGVTSTAIPITIANTVAGLGSVIQPFDTTLGTLDSVTITLMARAEQTITYVLNSPSISGSVNFTLSLTGVPSASTSASFDSTGNLNTSGLTFSPSLPNADFEVAANIPLGLTDNSTNQFGGNLSNTSPSMPGTSFPGGDIDVQVVYAYTPTPVTTPIPAALPLFATGIGGLGLLGWRRKRGQK